MFVGESFKSLLEQSTEELESSTSVPPVSILVRKSQRSSHCPRWSHDCFVQILSVACVLWGDSKMYDWIVLIESREMFIDRPSALSENTDWLAALKYSVR